MPLYLQSQPHTSNIMEDTLWTEIADAPGEIWDIPEVWDDEEDDDRTFEQFLASDWDF